VSNIHVEIAPSAIGIDGEDDVVYMANEFDEHVSAIKAKGQLFPAEPYLWLLEMVYSS
jgi:hypothetical protein